MESGGGGEGMREEGVIMAFGGVKALALGQELFCARVHSKLFFRREYNDQSGGGGDQGRRPIFHFNFFFLLLPSHFNQRRLNLFFYAAGEGVCY